MWWRFILLFTYLFLISKRQLIDARRRRHTLRKSFARFPREKPSTTNSREPRRNANNRVARRTRSGGNYVEKPRGQKVSPQSSRRPPSHRPFPSRTPLASSKQAQGCIFRQWSGRNRMEIEFFRPNARWPTDRVLRRCPGLQIDWRLHRSETNANRTSLAFLPQTYGVSEVRTAPVPDNVAGVDGCTPFWRAHTRFRDVFRWPRPPHPYQKKRIALRFRGAGRADGSWTD